MGSPERCPEAEAAGSPGLGSAPPPRSPPGRLGLLPAGPPARPPTSARGRGGGHGSAGEGAARGRRPSALPLLTDSDLRRDASGTNGLHYPRGPAIVRRHQAATVVLRASGFPSLPSLVPPFARILPASARSLRVSPPPRGARPSPSLRRRLRRPRPRGEAAPVRGGRQATSAGGLPGSRGHVTHEFPHGGCASWAGGPPFAEGGWFRHWSVTASVRLESFYSIKRKHPTKSNPF